MASKTDGGITGFLSGPTGWILAGAIAYVVYNLVKLGKGAVDVASQAAKDISAGFDPNPSSVEADQPLGPVPQGSRITAEILQPGNDGLAERNFIDRKFKVSVQIGNPGPARVAKVVTKVKVISRVTGSEELLQRARQVELPVGSKVFDDWFHLFSPFVHDGIAEVFVDDRSVATPHIFRIE